MIMTAQQERVDTPQYATQLNESSHSHPEDSKLDSDNVSPLSSQVYDHPEGGPSTVQYANDTDSLSSVRKPFTRPVPGE